MEGSKQRRITLPLAARVGAWLLAFATAITGISFLVQRTVVVWTKVDGTEGTYSAEPIDVSGVGLALFCVGLVMLTAMLIFEASRSPKPTGASASLS